MEDDRPAWDHVLARRLDGATLLVGLTIVSAEGDRHEQLHGTIVSADPEHGIAVRLGGQRQGEIYWLPPDLRPFEAARPGSFRLRSTGEIVDNPDFIANWTLTRPLS